ncbi:hypothetical protein EVAR_82586_1 [Eumeta japonica]|uniref:Uncharacterized protein n=1 Tax=Eumeta variegata TaxID=151549 RepID=A0A4C1UYI6_EUMVA|nr:hypothetical protein EVAR_82586_1 [Eumeta japonica]
MRRIRRSAYVDYLESLRFFKNPSGTATTQAISTKGTSQCHGCVSGVLHLTPLAYYLTILLFQLEELAINSCYTRVWCRRRDVDDHRHSIK